MSSRSGWKAKWNHGLINLKKSYDQNRLEDIYAIIDQSSIFYDKAAVIVLTLANKEWSNSSAASCTRWLAGLYCSGFCKWEIGFSLSSNPNFAWKNYIVCNGLEPIPLPNPNPIKNPLDYSRRPKLTKSLPPVMPSSMLWATVCKQDSTRASAGPALLLVSQVFMHW